MKKIKNIFAVIFACAITPAFCESLLQPTPFPKTFDDLNFSDKYAILAEGYAMFERTYDENGKCISGCPYTGLTIQEDQENTDEATEYLAELINQAEQDIETSGNKTLPKKIDGLPVRSPLKKSESITITSDFGWRTVTIKGKTETSMHGAIDIPVPTGTPLYATGDGVVTAVSTDSAGGKYIIIRHNNNFYSAYWHLSSQGVHVNDKVKAGDFIGKSGDTGFSSGPHLHYSIYMLKNNKKYFVDVLCPCFATNRNQADIKDVQRYSCKKNAMNHSFSFLPNTKNIDWRIKHGHCMKTRKDKLPGEI